MFEPDRGSFVSWRLTGDVLSLLHTVLSAVSESDSVLTSANWWHNGSELLLSWLESMLPGAKHDCLSQSEGVDFVEDKTWRFCPAGQLSAYAAEDDKGLTGDKSEHSPNGTEDESFKDVSIFSVSRLSADTVNCFDDTLPSCCYNMHIIPSDRLRYAWLCKYTQHALTS